MSKNKNNGRSFFSLASHLSVRKKILFAFSFIIFILVIQLVLSSNSLNSLSSDFNNLGTQSEIKEQTRKIISLYKSQEINYLSYLSNIGIDHKSIYQNISNQIASGVEDVKSNLKSLQKKDSDNNGINTFQPVIDNRIGTTTSIKNILNNRIPFPIIGNITTEAKNFEARILNKTALVLKWIYSDDQVTVGNEITQELLSQRFVQSLNKSMTPIVKNDINNYINTYKPIIDKLLVDYNTYAAQINSITFVITNAGGDITAADQDLLNTLVDKSVKYTKYLQGNITALLSQLDTEFILSLDSSDSLTTKITETTNQLTLLINWSLNKEADIKNHFIRTLGIELLILIPAFILFIIVSIAIVFIINRQVVKPIEIIAYWSEQISSGDLTKTPREKATRTDEVGLLQNNFKKMNDNLREIIGRFKQTSGLIATTAQDLSANTEEINATAEEVSAIAQSMAKGSTNQAELIATIVEELHATSDIVDNVISQINYNLIIIRDLSEQTNLLALNTAIEAANAGDFGKGFAVIAENIRKMSVSSKSATEQVTRDSKEILEKLQRTFENISEKIETVAAVSEETAASAEEVAASAEQMTGTMQSVSATSQVLNDQAFNSNKLVVRFKVDKEELKTVHKES